MKFDDFCLNASETLNAAFSGFFSKLCSAEDKFNKKNKLNIIVIACIAAVSFIIMLFLNMKTPFAADDFVYNFVLGDGALKVTDKRIESIADIITSMKAHYVYTNGRIITHFAVQLMMLLGKPIFNIINSLVYVFLTVVLYLNCVGKKCRKHSAVLFLAVNLAVWTFIRGWGLTTVWLTGSINYMWGSAFRLAALLPFRFYAQDGSAKHPVLTAIVMLFAGVIAGGTSENMSAVFIGMTVLFMIYYRMKKYRFAPFGITALAGALPSYAFMMLAPGNQVRIDDLGEPVHSLAYRFIGVPSLAVLYLSVILGAALIVAILLWARNRSSKDYSLGVPFIYLLGTAAGAGVMIFSPSFPERSWYGIIIMAIVCAGSLFCQIDRINVNYRRVFTVIVGVWSVFAFMQLYLTAKEAASYYQKSIQREAYIEEQKEAGNYDIVVDEIHVKQEHLPLYGVGDLSTERDSWRSISRSAYYGVNSITIEKVEQHQN